ncbi:DUF3515 domain-containing protein [Humidisolicoccus flavus]|uniref:DUF3515 domain-containing protein n=1 Tax=Humidisolicoccus flavus TaxID=3111414 RepID=UPI0032530493
MRIRIRNLLVVASLLGVVGLTACAAPVAMEPADDATNPGCAEVVVRLPQTLGDERSGTVLEERETNAQGTGAWGNPSAVLLHCGVPLPAPSDAQCLTVGGVDWLVTGQEEMVYTVTSFGRDPAVQLTIDTNLVTTSTVLDALSLAVSVTDQTPMQCRAAGDE